MAEEALQKLEKQLTCAICLDTFTYPKLLQCFHVYCQQCLVPLVVQDQQGITCPTCRQVTLTPDGGVAGLHSAFHINDLLEIQGSFKELDSSVVTLGGAVGGATTDDTVPSRKFNIGHCFEHGEEYKLYCGTCGELICWKCVLKGSKHHDHDYKEVDQAFKEYKKEITSLLEPMEKQVMTIKKALAQLDTRCGEISDQRAVTEDSIHGTFRRLQEVLNVRETELIGQLDEVTQRKLKGLAAQRDQIETSLAQLNSCLHFMRESLRTGNEGDVLMMKTNTIEQVEELIVPFQPYTLNPNTEADIAFSVSEDVTAMCSIYGQVLAPGLPDPTKFHTTGDIIEPAMVGKVYTAILWTINFEGKPCKEPIKSLECELESEIANYRASCSVERRGQSQYEISYQPTIKGRHQLHIKAEGQHVRGSPCSVAVKSPVEKLGTPILTIGGMDGPCGVAINQRGEMVITQWGGHCVSMFSPSGEKLVSFGSCGSGEGQFQHPRGVAVDSVGNIVVADSVNHCIQKFTAKGKFLTTVGTKGSGPLQFAHPAGITFNHSNSMVYVADEGNNRIQALNSDLTFSFGREGKGKGLFRSPQDVACDSTGKVYVADTGNCRIQVFTAEGKFLKMFGRRGQGEGDLGWPYGVAIDATTDIVYVSEWSNCRVSVFTSEGQFVTSFGRKGVGPGEFDGPRGLEVDDSGVVYVCDYLNNCVQIF